MLHCCEQDTHSRRSRRRRRRTEFLLRTVSNSCCPNSRLIFCLLIATSSRSWGGAIVPRSGGWTVGCRDVVLCVWSSSSGAAVDIARAQTAVVCSAWESRPCEYCRPPLWDSAAIHAVPCIFCSFWFSRSDNAGGLWTDWRDSCRLWMVVPVAVNQNRWRFLTVVAVAVSEVAVARVDR